MVKTLNKLGLEGNFLNWIKTIHQKNQLTIPKDEKLIAFLLRSGTRQGYLFSLLFSSLC